MNEEYPKLEKHSDSPGCYYVRLKQGHVARQSILATEPISITADIAEDGSVVGIEIVDFHSVSWAKQ